MTSKHYKVKDDKILVSSLLDDTKTALIELCA